MRWPAWPLLTRSPSRSRWSASLATTRWPAPNGCGNLPGHAQALATMRLCFNQLGTDDQTWCRDTLDRQAA